MNKRIWRHLIHLLREKSLCTFSGSRCKTPNYFYSEKCTCLFFSLINNVNMKNSTKGLVNMARKDRSPESTFTSVSALTHQSLALVALQKPERADLFSSFTETSEPGYLEAILPWALQTWHKKKMLFSFHISKNITTEGRQLFSSPLLEMWEETAVCWRSPMSHNLNLGHPIHAINKKRRSKSQWGVN